MTEWTEIQAEIERARAKFPAFHSQHEAYAVILEELDEFWDEVKKKREQEVERHRRPSAG